MFKLSLNIFSCVVQGLPFYIGVVIPVVFVCTKNVIILALVFRGIAKHRFKKHKKGVLASARIAFTCSILLGTAWIFGVLAIGDTRDFFQWLFCIFNSLQGMFIFLFYTVRNAEARKQWRKVFGFHQSGTDSSKFRGSQNQHRISGKKCVQQSPTSASL